MQYRMKYHIDFPSGRGLEAEKVIEADSEAAARTQAEAELETMKARVLFLPGMSEYLAKSAVSLVVEPVT